MTLPKQIFTRYHAWRFKVLSRRIALIDGICSRRSLNLSEHPNIAVKLIELRSRARWHLDRSGLEPTFEKLRDLTRFEAESMGLANDTKANRAKINKLFDGVPPYTPEQLPKFDKTPLPSEIVTVTGTGNPKWDKIMADVLNKNPKFRKAVERIAKREAERRANEILYGKPGEGEIRLDSKKLLEAYGNLSKNEGFRVAGVGNPNVATDETKDEAK